MHVQLRDMSLSQSFCDIFESPYRRAFKIKHFACERDLCVGGFILLKSRINRPFLKQNVLFYRPPYTWVSEKEPHLWCGLFRNIWIREPITSPTGVKYEWNDEKKNYFNEKDEILPEEGFHHEGVCYKYNIETNSWMADGKPLQTSQSQTYKDENGTTYFWNEVKKLWVTGKFFGSTADPRFVAVRSWSTRTE